MFLSILNINHFVTEIKEVKQFIHGKYIILYLNKLLEVDCDRMVETRILAFEVPSLTTT